MLKEDLLSGASAAAAYIGVPARAVYHLVETDRLPVTRMGRRLYFRKTELEAAFRAEQPR
jgi:excisionase family DNA binding protein